MSEKFKNKKVQTTTTDRSGESCTSKESRVILEMIIGET